MALILPLKPAITTTKIVVGAIKVDQVQSQLEVSWILHPEGQKTTYARWKLMERTRHVKSRSTPLQQSLPVKNTGWVIPFIPQPVGGSRRLAQVGALPHSTLLFCWVLSIPSSKNKVRMTEIRGKTYNLRYFYGYVWRTCAGGPPVGSPPPPPPIL